MKPIISKSNDNSVVRWYCLIEMGLWKDLIELKKSRLWKDTDINREFVISATRSMAGGKIEVVYRNTYLKRT